MLVAVGIAQGVAGYEGRPIHDQWCKAVQHVIEMVLGLVRGCDAEQVYHDPIDHQQGPIQFRILVGIGALGAH